MAEIKQKKYLFEVSFIDKNNRFDKFYYHSQHKRIFIEKIFLKMYVNYQLNGSKTTVKKID